MTDPSSDATALSLARVARAMPAFKAFLDIVDALYADVQRARADALASLSEPPDGELTKLYQRFSPYHRRTLVRTWFAYFEGYVYCLKQVALAAHDASDPFLEPGEQLALMERDIWLEREGTVKLRQTYPPVLPGFRLAHRLVRRAFPSAPEPDHSINGWECLQAAVAIRNRITHPKNAEELEVTDGEFLNSLNAFMWVLRVSLAWGEAMATALAASRRTQDGQTGTGGAEG